jgi:hypothetical protein
VNIGVFRSMVAEGPQRPRSIYLIGRPFGILAENSNHLPHSLHLPRPQPVPIVWMCWAWRRTTTSTVNAAHPPTTHSRRLATLPCPLGSGRTSGRVSEALCGVYGVSGTFYYQASPPCVTSPTMACPPSFTVTRSTLTVCLALARYFLSVSIWAR